MVSFQSLLERQFRRGLKWLNVYQVEDVFWKNIYNKYSVKIFLPYNAQYFLMYSVEDKLHFIILPSTWNINLLGHSSAEHMFLGEYSRGKWHHENSDVRQAILIK